MKDGAFSPREDRILARMWRAEFSDAEIAEDFGRSVQSVKNRRTHLGLVKDTPGPSQGGPVFDHSDTFVARLYAVHPEGYQDGPVKQVRRVHYQAVTGLPILQSCMA